MGTGTCFVCDRFKFSEARKSEPSVEASGLDTVRVECPRCGTYTASRDWYDDTPNRKRPIDEAVGLRVSALVRDHNDRRLRPLFLITHESFDVLEKEPTTKPTYSTYVEKLLLQFASRTSYPSLASEAVAYEELAARVSLPGRAMKQLLTQMRDQELFSVTQGEYQNYAVQIQPKGWTRVDELQASRPRSDRAFVAMWFDPSVRSAYGDGIEPALLACGYDRPFRVDDPAHQKDADKPEFQPKIDDRIIAEIRRARFVVVDVTGERPAVYYEAGFAEGLGTPVLWACEKGAKMCFDTRQKEHILWTTPADLRTQLEDKIRARGWDRKR